MTAALLHIPRTFCSPLARPFIASTPVKALLSLIDAHGGKGVLVGGCVRDHVMNVPAKDIDIEVYGLEKNRLEDILSKHFSVVPVGKSFGIFKVTVGTGDDRETIDVALPRSENKAGSGHKGFIVECDPAMPFIKASARRDFTINAMGIDLATNELLDPHGGFAHIQSHLLKHVSEAFSEDPLRVLRAAQFCARFDFTLDSDTAKLCQSLCEELKTLSRERIFEEFKKLILSPKPSVGLQVLREVDALIIFPQLFQLIDCKQDPQWHPEGDVWIHSLMVSDQAATLCRAIDMDESERLIVMMGALCHDLGKPSTTIEKDGRIKSPGHDQEGAAPTAQFLTAVGFPQKWFDDVITLVKEHLKPFQLYAKRDEVNDSALRRLACRVNIERLLIVAKADFLGRTTPEALSGHDPSTVWLKEKMREVLGADSAPKPILLGRHLIDLGEKPGPSFAAVLRAAFEAQLDGEFSDQKGAIAWAKNWLAAGLRK